MGKSVLDAVLELAEYHGVENIRELAGAWEQRVDDDWYVAGNGHADSVVVEPEGGMRARIPGYHFCVWCRGWIAGLFSVDGGEFVVGESVGAEAFVAAVERHVGEGETGGQAEVA